MALTVGAYDAKTHLPRLLEQVEGGEVVTITRHGRPVARLVPVDASFRSPVELIADIKHLRQGVRRGRSSVRQMIDEGRR